MKEWHRTIVLLALLALGIAFLVWTGQVYERGFVHSL
jgi:hypothetical protein